MAIETTGPDSQDSKVGWAQLFTGGSISGVAVLRQKLGTPAAGRTIRIAKPSNVLRVCLKCSLDQTDVGNVPGRLRVRSPDLGSFTDGQGDSSRNTPSTELIPPPFQCCLMPSSSLR
jgi:hypothetical protein